MLMQAGRAAAEAAHVLQPDLRPGSALPNTPTGSLGSLPKSPYRGLLSPRRQSDTSAFQAFLSPMSITPHDSELAPLLRKGNS